MTKFRCVVIGRCSVPRAPLGGRHSRRAVRWSVLASAVLLVVCLLSFCLVGVHVFGGAAFLVVSICLLSWCMGCSSLVVAPGFVVCVR